MYKKNTLIGNLVGVKRVGIGRFIQIQTIKKHAFLRLKSPDTYFNC